MRCKFQEKKEFSQNEAKKHIQHTKKQHGTTIKYTKWINIFEKRGKEMNKMIFILRVWYIVWCIRIHNFYIHSKML